MKRDSKEYDWLYLIPTKRELAIIDMLALHSWEEMGWKCFNGWFP